MPEMSYDKEYGVYTKKCPKCGIVAKGTTEFFSSEKEITLHFSTSNQTSDGFYGVCKICVAKYNHSKRHGREINVEEVYEQQKGRCAICETPLSLLRKFGSPVRVNVDHCHATNKTRGLLCSSCNTRLSGVEDEAWRAKALDYLRHHEDN